MEKEHALTSGSLDSIVVDVVIDVSRAFEDQIAVERAGDDIFFKEGSASVADVNTVAEGCSDLIEENMRVSVAVDPDSYFFVEFDHIIPDF